MAAPLALVVAAAFWPVFLRGESLMAAMRGPGVTYEGPVDARAMLAPPVADSVASYIDEPLAVYTATLLDRREWPVWNPHNGLGVPLLGNWQTSIPSPMRVLVHAFPHSTWAFDATYLLRLLIGATGAALLAVRLGIAGWGAFASGVAFGLTGYFVRYLQMHHLNAEVLLPWLWLAADALARRPRPATLLGFAVVVYAVLVGGNPQPALVAAVVSGAFALWRAGVWGVKGLRRVVLAAVPPMLLAAPYWLAGLEYVRVAVHHHDARFGHDAYTAGAALGLLVPDVVAPAAVDYTLVAPYLGLVPIVLALAGLGRGPGRSVVLWGLLVLGVGKIAGAPGTGWIGDLPGFSMMKMFKYLYPAPALVLALLSGAGLTALVEAERARRRAVLAALAGLALLAGLTWAALDVCARAPVDREGVPLFTFAAWPGILWRVVLVGAIVAATAGLRPRARAAALAALVAVELVGATPSKWLPRLDPFGRPDYLAAFEHLRPGSFRTFGVTGILIPNQNAVFGIDDIRLHDGMFPRRYGRFVRRFLNPNVRHWPVFTGEDIGELEADQVPHGLAVANLLLPQAVARGIGPSVKVPLYMPTPARYLDLLNVRYLITPMPPTAEERRLLRDFVAKWPPAGGYRIAHEGEDGLVIERTTALPRAFFPLQVDPVPDEDTAFEMLARDEFDPRRIAYLEVPADELGDHRPGAGAARVAAPVGSTPPSTEQVFEVYSEGPAWLVVSVYPYPGLQAEIERRVGGGLVREPARLVAANATVCAVRVPPGSSRLRLVYRPTWVGPGAALALAGLAALLAAAAAARKAARAD